MKKILYFSAEWCGVCKRINPLIDTLINEGIDIQKIDIDKNPELKSKYEIEYMPTFIFERKDKVLLKKVGVMNENQIKKLWENY